MVKNAFLMVCMLPIMAMASVSIDLVSDNGDIEVWLNESSNVAVISQARIVFDLENNPDFDIVAIDDSTVTEITATLPEGRFCYDWEPDSTLTLQAGTPVHIATVRPHGTTRMTIRDTGSTPNTELYPVNEWDEVESTDYVSFAAIFQMDTRKGKYCVYIWNIGDADIAVDDADVPIYVTTDTANHLAQSRQPVGYTFSGIFDPVHPMNQVTGDGEYFYSYTDSGTACDRYILEPNESMLIGVFTPDQAGGTASIEHPMYGHTVFPRIYAVRVMDPSDCTQDIDLGNITGHEYCSTDY